MLPFLGTRPPWIASSWRKAPRQGALHAAAGPASPPSGPGPPSRPGLHSLPCLTPVRLPGAASPVWAPACEGAEPPEASPCVGGGKALTVLTARVAGLGVYVARHWLRGRRQTCTNRSAAGEVCTLVALQTAPHRRSPIACFPRRQPPQGVADARCCRPCLLRRSPSGCGQSEACHTSRREARAPAAVHRGGCRCQH